MKAMAASLLVLLASAAPAADDAARQQLEQRIQLSAKLLGDTPAMQRIVASGRVRPPPGAHGACFTKALMRSTMRLPANCSSEAMGWSAWVTTV